MARGDFKLRDPHNNQMTVRAVVGSGTANSIKAGEPTLDADATGAATGKVKIAADGDPTNASAHRFTGVAKSDSDDTAAADGHVDVWLPFSGIVYEGKAKTSTTANTQALVDGLRFKRVVFDLTGTSWTVDAGATDATTNGIVIVDGDYTTTRIYFVVAPHVTILTGAN